MKFLLDMPVSRSLIALLQRLGHEAAHVSDLGLGRAPDHEILARARQDGAVLVTADLDFPRLMVLGWSTGPGIILFRGGSYSDAEMTSLLERVLVAVPAETLGQAICVVDQRRIRVTTLPIDRHERE